MNSLPQQFILLVFLLFHFHSKGQEPICQILNTERGLPSNTIYKIDQDSKGIIWAATERGICSYDGYQFKTYTSDLYSDYNMLYMRIDNHDRIWHINLSGNLYYIEQGRVVPISDYKYDNYSIVSFELINDDIILIAKLGEVRRALIFTLQENRFVLKQEIRNGFRVSELYAMKSITSLYLLQAETLCTNIDVFNKDYSINTDFKIDYPLKKIRLVSKDRFIGKSENGVILISKETLVDEVKGSIDYYHAEVYDSICWLLSNSGMQALHFKDEQMKVDAPILSDFKILSVFKDVEGNFWIGTKNSGLLFTTNLSSVNYNKDNSKLTCDYIRSLTLNGPGNLYIGLEDGHVAHLYDDSISILEPNFGNEINTIIEEKGQIYVASNRGFSKYSLINKERYELLGATKDVALGLDGNILLATHQSTFEVRNEKSSLSQARPARKMINLSRSYAVRVDSNNRTWVGSIRGLKVYNNNYELYGTILNYNISDIEMVNDSIVYVSTFAHGVFRIINLEIDSSFNTLVEFSSNNITDLSYANDNLYVSTAGGLDIVNTSNNKIMYLNESSGLPSKEIAASVSDGNFIWVATGKGLCKIPKPRSKNDQKTFHINFNKVLINHKDTAILKNYRLNKDQRYVDVQFSIPEFSAINLTDFYFRTIPQDTTWQLAYGNKIRLNKLPYGQSEFEMYAVNRNDLRQTKVESIKFNVATPLVHIPWFRVLSLVSLLTTLFVLWTRYIYNKHKKEKELLVNQRMIDGLKLMALQNHMNPHFISNSLFAIQDMLDKNQRWNAWTFTSEFAGIVRQTMHMTTLERIDLVEEIEFLKKYIRLEKMRFELPPECDIIIGNKVLENITNIHVPPLIIQPIIENAFKHAGLGRVLGSKLKINFSYGNGYVICEVLDNGFGVKAIGNQVFEMANGSTGLRTVKERLLLNAKLFGWDLNKTEFVTMERMSRDNEEYTRVTLKICYQHEN